MGPSLHLTPRVVQPLRRLLRRVPGIGDDTWTADESPHMRAINPALGFRPHAVNGAWQAKL